MNWLWGSWTEGWQAPAFIPAAGEAHRGLGRGEAHGEINFSSCFPPAQRHSKGSFLGNEMMVSLILPPSEHGGACPAEPAEQRPRGVTQRCQELPAAGLGTKPGGKSGHTAPGHAAPEPAGISDEQLVKSL